MVYTSLQDIGGYMTDVNPSEVGGGEILLQPPFEVRQGLPDRYDDVPEHLRPREYGNHLLHTVDLGNLIRVHQVRLGENPEMKALQHSIENNKLLNLVDVAVMNQEALQKYLDFVRRLWGSTQTIDDYTPDAFGRYYLVIAGHSRIEAITRNERDRQKKAKAQGYDTNWEDAPVTVKIHDVQDSKDILQIQLDENTYKEPSEERQAIAIIEMYYYGRELEQWSSIAGFIEAIKGKFSYRMVERALNFAKLPEVGQALVTSGQYPYAMACEVGRLADPYREVAISTLDDPTQANDFIHDIDAMVAKFLICKLDDYHKRRQSLAVTKKDIDKEIVGLGFAKRIYNGDEQLFRDPNEEFYREQKRLRRELANTLRGMTGSKLDQSAHAIGLVLEMFPEDDPDALAIQRDINLNHEVFFRRLGGSPTSETVVVPDLFADAG
jgi:hypothetical protein